MIKEPAKPDQSLPVKKVYSEDEYKNKGKGKMDEHLEQGMIYPLKSTSDIAQVKVPVIGRSTTDTAHVDQIQKEKSITDKAYIDNVEKEKEKTTTDEAQVDSSKKFKSIPLSDELLKKFPAKPTLHEQEEIEKENPTDFQLRQKVARDRGGLGSGRENWRDANETSTKDPSSLAEPKKGITQSNLDKQESTQLVKWKGEEKYELLYFLTDGKVHRVKEQNLYLKLDEELEYVLYIFRIRNQATFRYTNLIRDILDNRKLVVGRKSVGPYVPRYLNHEGKEIEMKKNSSRFQTIAGIRVLTFNEDSPRGYMIRLGNEMRNNSIYNLRAAIYQTGNNDPELSMVKNQMVEALIEAEQRLLRGYLRMQYDLEAIQG